MLPAPSSRQGSSPPSRARERLASEEPVIAHLGHQVEHDLNHGVVYRSVRHRGRPGGSEIIRSRLGVVRKRTQQEDKGVVAGALHGVL
jgi:hypothetical protein